MSWFWKRLGFLMPHHPLTNFEIQKYYENEPRLIGIFSRDNMQKKNNNNNNKKIKDGAYAINLDE